MNCENECPSLASEIIQQIISEVSLTEMPLLTGEIEIEVSFRFPCTLNFFEFDPSCLRPEGTSDADWNAFVVDLVAQLNGDLDDDDEDDQPENHINISITDTGDAE